MEVPHLKILIEETSLVEGAKEILSFIRPKWDLTETSFKVGKMYVDVIVGFYGNNEFSGIIG